MSEFCKRCGSNEWGIRKSSQKGHRYCRVCHRKAARKAKLKNNFGLTEAEYEEMVMLQCGLCAICSSFFNIRLAVHHNHGTGEVVALLCTNCNRGMGLLKDDVSLLRRAALVHSGN